jgi:hypothetical protein
MVCRGGKDLWAFDLAAGTRCKYARGCSPGLSPDGAWVMSNTGGHTSMTIQSWDGRKRFRIDTRTSTAGRQWDNHHWSNHADWIAGESEGTEQDALVIDVRRNQVYRVTWVGGVGYPDLWVGKAAGEKGTGEDAKADDPGAGRDGKREGTAARDRAAKASG